MPKLRRSALALAKEPHPLPARSELSRSSTSPTIDDDNHAPANTSIPTTFRFGSNATKPAARDDTDSNSIADSCSADGFSFKFGPSPAAAVTRTRSAATGASTRPGNSSIVFEIGSTEGGNSSKKRRILRAKRPAQAASAQAIQSRTPGIDDDDDECKGEISEVDEDEDEVDEDESDHSEDESEEDEDEDSSHDSDEDGEYESEDEECHCSHCMEQRLEIAHLTNNDDDSDDASMPDLEYNGAQCAICFDKPKTNNPLITLPCCGSDGTEATSSTRFCKKCITKTLKSQDLYNTLRPWSSNFVGECPRCRNLISVAKEETEHRDRIVPATFRQAIRHANNREEYSTLMQCVLVTASYANPRFMPLELLEGDEDKLRQMCTWGILSKKRKGVYVIDPKNQIELREYVECNVLPQLEDEKDALPGLLVVASKSFMTGLELVLALKFWTSIRMFNQSGAMSLCFLFSFPIIEHPWQEWIVGGLNILLVAMIIQVLLFLAVYGAVGYASIKIMGWLIAEPKHTLSSFFKYFGIVLFAVAAYRNYGYVWSACLSLFSMLL